MTVKDRSQFLIERYGPQSIEVIKEIIEREFDDEETVKYWKEVLKLCQESLKNQTK